MYIYRNALWILNYSTHFRRNTQLSEIIRHRGRGCFTIEVFLETKVTHIGTNTESMKTKVKVN